jgi:hypothetical protein
MFVYQMSMLRLLGHRENRRECVRAGISNYDSRVAAASNPGTARH